MAVFTPTVTVDEIKAIKHEVLGDKIIVVKLACLSVSSSDGGTVTMKSTRKDPTNTYRHIMDTAAAFDIDIENKRNSHILDTTNVHTATSFVSGSATIGLFPPIMDELTVVISTLGDTKTADIYLYFSK